MLQGSVDLLNEVSTKITGEEEIYSHTDYTILKLISKVHKNLRIV